MAVATETSRILLAAAEAFVGAADVADVRRRVRDLVISDLEPVYVGLVTLVRAGDGAPHAVRVLDPEFDIRPETDYRTFGVDASWPTARAMSSNRIVTVTSRAELTRDYGPEAVDVWDTLGFASLAAVPLTGTRETIGALIIAWSQPYVLSDEERAVLTAIAAYAAGATERAVFLEERISVARRLQQHLLPDVRPVAGLDVAAHYRPAATRDLVGGDWYDAYPVSGTGVRGRKLAVTIGDITGHNAEAAALMGQARSMLRQADFDHPGRGPASAVEAVEQACFALDVPLSGTLVHAHLAAVDDGCWDVHWTNAGHPPPIVVSPDREVRLLHDHDRLIFPLLGPTRRTVHRVRLPPGAILLLYTDGLVEHRNTVVDHHIGRAARILAEEAARGTPLPGILARLAAEVPPSSGADDLALLVVRCASGRLPPPRSADPAPAAP
ncbi:PP2C family protein-serine/threonine phosphatase [Streptomyces tropicalis]|uniref:SpoIIE family protein phosphatase n=1 Tax=Streptomyces tropicalis TaxID=3034234 RepID=A0ABT6A9X5_9ACTN|nr:GAF domain-containing SpoIIE family protein phosphatase [Streptomyces tropicalis]MDF3301456.1 SpoIIE family protein phosphatase [Streptomyces tropicalis]